MHSICNITFDLGLFKRFKMVLWSFYYVNSILSKYIYCVHKLKLQYAEKFQFGLGISLICRHNYREEQGTVLWLSLFFCKSIVEIRHMGWCRCKLYSLYRFVKITEAVITIYTNFYKSFITGYSPIKINFLL